MTNISDLSSPYVNNGGAASLPIRTEKIITLSEDDYGPDTAAYHVSAARKAYRDYIMVRIPGRGGNTPGIYNDEAAVYKFLINPSEVQINHTTVDKQAFTRSGWQIGVWGEEIMVISLKGETPGSYFKNGITDSYDQFSESYRNRVALELVFENNGYWYEGEQVFSRLRPASTHIKMHQDIELYCAEFIWNGMFESMKVVEDSATPYNSAFSIDFIAWKERFRSNTPYINSIGGEVQRGHVPSRGSRVLLAENPYVKTPNMDLTRYIMEPSTGDWTIS